MHDDIEQPETPLGISLSSNHRNIGTRGRALRARNLLLANLGWCLRVVRGGIIGHGVNEPFQK